MLRTRLRYDPEPRPIPVSGPLQPLRSFDSWPALYEETCRCFYIPVEIFQMSENGEYVLPTVTLSEFSYGNTPWYTVFLEGVIFCETPSIETGISRATGVLDEISSFHAGVAEARSLEARLVATHARKRGTKLTNRSTPRNTQSTRSNAGRRPVSPDKVIELDETETASGPSSMPVRTNGAPESRQRVTAAVPQRQRITDVAHYTPSSGRTFNKGIEEMFGDRDFLITWLSGEIKSFQNDKMNTPLEYMDGMITDPDDGEGELIEVSFSGKRVLGLLYNLTNGTEWANEEGLIARLVWVQQGRNQGWWELQ